MIKRIDPLVRSYFIFSKTERKGVVILLCLMVLLAFFPMVYRQVFPAVLPQIELRELRSLSYDTESVTAGSEPFTFDPNTATSTDLQQLGLSEKQAGIILNYREKGGKFRKPEDIARMYGIPAALSERLIPYVKIPHGNRASAFPTDTVRRKKPQGVVELNTADSEEIVALYRVGPALAHRIIEQRQKLGGFLSLDQLKELWGFDEDILYDLKGKIRVDASKAVIHDLNTVTLDELRAHPYFKYKLSSAIINYRMQHGKFTSLSDLKKIELMNDSIYGRVTRYLRVE
jgi:DNA uptake protein ComE-like DNA-binding protein